MRKILMNAVIKTGLNDNGDIIIYLLTLYGTTKKNLLTFLQLPQRDAPTFYSFSQVTAYIKRLAKNNGFYIDIVSNDFNSVLYDINFIDISNDTPRVDHYFINNLI